MPYTPNTIWCVNHPVHERLQAAHNSVSRHSGKRRIHQKAKGATARATPLWFRRSCARHARYCRTRKLAGGQDHVNFAPQRVIHDSGGPGGVVVRRARQLGLERLGVHPPYLGYLSRIGADLARPASDQHMIQLVLHEPVPKLGEIDKVPSQNELAPLDPQLVAEAASRGLGDGFSGTRMTTTRVRPKPARVVFRGGPALK